MPRNRGRLVAYRTVNGVIERLPVSVIAEREGITRQSAYWRVVKTPDGWVFRPRLPQGRRPESSRPPRPHGGARTPTPIYAADGTLIAPTLTAAAVELGMAGTTIKRRSEPWRDGRRMRSETSG